MQRKQYRSYADQKANDYFTLWPTTTDSIVSKISRDLLDRDMTVIFSDNVDRPAAGLRIMIEDEDEDEPRRPLDKRRPVYWFPLQWFEGLTILCRYINYHRFLIRTGRPMLEDDDIDSEIMERIQALIVKFGKNLIFGNQLIESLIDLISKFHPVSTIPAFSIVVKPMPRLLTKFLEIEWAGGDHGGGKSGKAAKRVGSSQDVKIQCSAISELRYSTFIFQLYTN